MTMYTPDGRYIEQGDGHDPNEHRHAARYLLPWTLHPLSEQEATEAEGDGYWITDAYGEKVAEHLTIEVAALLLGAPDLLMGVEDALYVFDMSIGNWHRLRAQVTDARDKATGNYPQTAQRGGMNT